MIPLGGAVVRLTVVVADLGAVSAVGAPAAGVMVVDRSLDIATVARMVTEFSAGAVGWASRVVRPSDVPAHDVAAE